jgi:hypothetical protein
MRFNFKQMRLSFRHVTFNFTHARFGCTYVRFHCFATCSTFCLILFTCLSLGVNTRIFRLYCGDVRSSDSSVDVETDCRL